MPKSKARQELDKDRDFILWLFDYKCVKCGAPYAHIHEIIPISHGKIALEWRNRVTLCQRCHSWGHDVGTNRSIPILQEARKLFLIRHFELGGSDVY
jgi:5-methylcytosine-specific restriction endonuclease McrA